jgi:DNA-binding CsgD family transcriptional regulator
LEKSAKNGGLKVLGPSGETVSKLLGHLYEAAACPEHWTEFFRELGNRFSEHKSFFILVDSENPGSIEMLYGESDTDHAQVYTEYFFQHDVLYQRFNRAKQIHGEWIGTSQSVISDHDYHKSMIYNELALPNGAPYQCGVALGGLNEGLEGGLTICKGSGGGPFSSDDVALLTILAPHMKRALNLHRTLSNERAQAAELRHAVDALNLVLISLDRQGRVLRTTSAARALLQLRDGLWLDGERLRAGVPKEDTHLSQLIAGASATGAGRGEAFAMRRSTATAPEAGATPLWTPSAGGAMLISRTPPKRPLQLVVTPFYSSEILLAEHPAALILLSDPDGQTVSRASILGALYNLSPAECRMADLLAKGIPIADVADKMRTTVGTARFRLKEIFRKTNTSRQAQLIQLIGGLPGIRTVHAEPPSTASVPTNSPRP